MNKTIGLIVVLFSIVATSCSKKTVSPVTISPPKPTLSIEEINFEYLQGKARMILRDAQKERDVKANIRVRKDSVIWMTFSVIGVQGGKALINRDSITIVSTVDKEYYVFPYSELSDRFQFEIDYQVVQAAMLGNPIIPRSERDEVEQESSMYLLHQQHHYD